MLTNLNALPLAHTELSVGSTQVGFIMALVGVPVKENCSKMLDIGGERGTLVLVNRLGA